VIRGARAAGSQPAAAEAAQLVLDTGGGAVDAAIAGFLAAAGADPGVLLAPAMGLVAGFGTGARVFDGRAAQPGLGAARPRGFVADAVIPAGARVAVPRSIGMLVLLHTYRGRASLHELARAGVAAAESAGAKQRALLVRKVGQAGVLALRSPEVTRVLLAAGGAVAGGALTAADLEETAPAEMEATALVVGGGLTVYTPPFTPADEALGDAEVVVTCDQRGVLAAIAYVPARGGVVLSDLEIEVGRDAVPVRRGVTRLPPGTPLPMAAPLAIAVQNAGFAAAVGLPGRPAIDAAAAGELARGAALETALAELRERLGGRAAVAVVTDGKAARSAQA
jgi:gamma-glutamyltranspeptidase/glutathione hydrolase